MNNFDKVEAYFNNELSSSEKNEFLNEIETNTELQSEYNFQNEVINGIKQARKAELKAMLDKVPITAVSTAATGLYKIFAGSVATILLGTAAWYYFTPTEQIELTYNTEIVEILPNNSIDKNEIVEELKKESTIALVTKEEVTKQSTNEVVEKETTPTINIPTLPDSENEFENETLQEENLDIPSDISSTSINLSTKVDVKIVLKKKYNFHYQYSQAKLVLYGDFEEGLFEVLELNKENKVDVYLYYKSNFYYIKDKTDAITPLKSVVDKSLKLKLERLR